MPWSRRAPKMLVGAGNELASKQLFRAPHTHTIFLSFTCSTYKARQACKSEAKIMQREHPNCTTFRICFSLYAVVGGAAISLRRRRLDGTWYPRRGLKRAKNGLLSADRSCQRLPTSPVLTLISGVLQRSCTSGKKWPFDLHFAQDTWCCNSYTRGVPSLKFAGPRSADPAGSI